MSEKKHGAKIAPFYDPQAAYRRELFEREQERDGLRLNCCGYVVALGYRFQDEPGSMTYAGENGTANNPQDAIIFDTWEAATRYALDNCEFPALDFVPRGFERPKFPRVCFARIWEEITEC